jgi:hypothetical protein
LERLHDITVELGEASIGCGRKRPDDHVGAVGEIGQTRLHDVPQPALDLVSDHGTADCLGDDESGTRRRCRPVEVCRIVMKLGAGRQMDDHTTAGTATAGTDRRGEFIAAAKPVSGGQHR